MFTVICLIAIPLHRGDAHLVVHPVNETRFVVVNCCHVHGLVQQTKPDMCHIVQYTMHGNTYHTIQTFYGKKKNMQKVFWSCIIKQLLTGGWKTQLRSNVITATEHKNAFQHYCTPAFKEHPSASWKFYFFLALEPFWRDSILRLHYDSHRFQQDQHNSNIIVKHSFEQFITQIYLPISHKNTAEPNTVCWGLFW